MAKKRNFNYEKRQKEMRKQKKRQEKLDARRAKKADGDDGEASGTPEAEVFEEVEGFDDPEPRR